jgi:hypothetical protein
MPERGASASREAFDWPLVVICFVLLAGIAVLRAWLTAKSTPLLDDTDDAMRLQTVRDLIAGQGWWDHVQHRLNAPFGAEIHWWHAIDAAIAGIILVLRPFAGTGAETLALYLWPMLLLFLLLALSGRLAYALGGREAMLPALILPLVSPAVLTEFSPGRIDHHSIQILLTLLMAWATVETIARPRFAILAALGAALSFAVGIEGLPSVASAILGMALIWVAKPERAQAMRAFGLTFGLGGIAVLVDQYPPERWFEPACDEISIVYTAFAVGVGAILVVLSWLPLGAARPWQRLALGGALAAGLALLLAKTFPLCLKGPYAALDPWLVQNWLDHISEAKPVWQSFAAAPIFTLGVAAPPLLGLAVVAARLLRGEPQKRGEWLLLGLFLLFAVVVMCAQIRGARLAMPLALPAAGWLVAMARRRYLMGRRLSGALGMVASWLGFAGFVLGLIATVATLPFDKAEAAAPANAAGNSDSCLMPEAFRTLAALPPARVMTPVDLGSHVLVHTPHAVVAAPYHRDQAGVRDAYRFFNDPLPEAHRVLLDRGVTLVAICPAMPEVRGLPSATPDSFARLYAEGRLPDWLVPVSPAGDVLKVFRVLP